MGSNRTVEGNFSLNTSHMTLAMSQHPKETAPPPTPRPPGALNFPHIRREAPEPSDNAADSDGGQILTVVTRSHCFSPRGVKV